MQNASYENWETMYNYSKIYFENTLEMKFHQKPYKNTLKKTPLNKNTLSKKNCKKICPNYYQ